MMMVYVQNKDGKPLMPTTRYCYVRLLLKEKKARVVCTTPFTIQLNYDTPNITQDMILGIDPGRTNIGVAVVKKSGQCVFSAHLETRNKDVPLLMQKRAGFRRSHRTLDRRKNASVEQKLREPLSPRVLSRDCFRVMRNLLCVTIFAIRKRGLIIVSALRVG